MRIITRIRIYLLELSVKTASSVEEQEQYEHIQRLAYEASCEFIKSNTLYIPNLCLLNKNFLRCFRHCFNEFLFERNFDFFFIR